MDEEIKKAGGDISEEAKAKNENMPKLKRTLSMDEYQYYNLACLKLREENHNVMGMAIFLASFIFVACGLLPKIDLNNVALDIALFLMGIAGLSLLGSAVLSLFSNNLLLRFLILISQKNVILDRKALIHLFQKGYSFRQAAKLLWISGIVELMLGFLAYCADLNIILAICLIVVVVGMSYWLWQYMKFVNKTGAFRIPHKAMISSIETEEAEIPPVGTEDKNKFDEKMLVPAMRAVLQNSSEHVRKDAIRVLGKMATPESIQILLSLLGDASSTIRAQAIAALGRSGEKNIKEALYCLIGDETMEVRIAVANALGLLHDEDAGDLLLGALEDRTPEVRGAAAEALGNIRYKKALKRLIGHAADPDWFVRYNSIIALGKLKNYITPESFQKIVDSLHDEHPEVRAAGLHVVQKLKKELAKEDPLYPELEEILGHLSQETTEDRQLAGESGHSTPPPPTRPPTPILPSALAKEATSSLTKDATPSSAHLATPPSPTTSDANSSSQPPSLPSDSTPTKLDDQAPHKPNPDSTTSNSESL